MGYKKHKFACIPMAATYIDTSSVRVQFAIVQVVSAWVLFSGNPYE